MRPPGGMRLLPDGDVLGRAPASAWRVVVEVGDVRRQIANVRVVGATHRLNQVVAEHRAQEVTRRHAMLDPRHQALEHVLGNRKLAEGVAAHAASSGNGRSESSSAFATRGPPSIWTS